MAIASTKLAQTSAITGITLDIVVELVPDSLKNWGNSNGIGGAF